METITAGHRNPVVRLQAHIGDEFIWGVRHTHSTPGEATPGIYIEYIHMYRHMCVRACVEPGS